MIIIWSFFLSLNCPAFSSDIPSDSSTLSPAVSIADYGIKASVLDYLRNEIIDSYIEQSLLSEFEYRSLKLDVIFGAKTNSAEIEKQVMELIEKDDLHNYFDAYGESKEKVIKTRLKVRDIFHALLENNGY
jgi:hypothetical protein